MSDGKLSSKDGSTLDSEAESTKKSTDSAPLKLGGSRFRTPSAGRIDLASAVPEEDEAVEQVARRFRNTSSFKGIKSESLDSQKSDKANTLSKTELEGFLLDALDAPAESASPGNDYVLEEVMTDAIHRPAGEQLARSVESPRTEPAQPDLICRSCQAINPAGMRFCVQCGGGLAVEAKSSPQGRKEEPQREPPPPTQAARQESPWPIRLVSINEDGSDGQSIALEYLETTAGRDGDSRFPTDAFLSPKHVRFHIEQGELFIEDLYSLNGTFLKLRDEVRLTPGDTILMGRQVLRFERFEQSITPKTKSSDGTRYMGSPAPGGNFKILQIGIGGVIQNVYCLPESGAVLGREKGDIVFPHDKFMSSRHAQVYAGDDGHCYLVDLNSSNGTWIKLWEKTKLVHRDYIFMGQQLFRVQHKSKKS